MAIIPGSLSAEQEWTESAIWKSAWFPPLLIAVIYLIGLSYPVGFGGGGADDGQYLEEAACWIRQGLCIPADHWGGRWPVVLLTAGGYRLFGLNEVGIGLPFMLAGAISLALIAKIGNRIGGRPTGYWAAALLAATPAFLIEVSHPAVEPIELMFLLCAVVAGLDRRFAMLGLCLGLAFQTRETSLAGLLIALAIVRREPRHVAMILAGFAIPLAAEFIFFAALTGDPLWRRGLSLDHTKIPSSELLVRDGNIPIFNRSLLQNWRYEPGIRIHWLIDGLANLMINIKTALLPLLALTVFALARQKKPVAATVLVAGFGYAAFQIYVLCVDPKPRMFVPSLAAFALVISLCASGVARKLMVLLLALAFPLASIAYVAQPRMREWIAKAEELDRAFPNAVRVANPTWTMSRQLQRPRDPNARIVLVFEPKGCAPGAIASKRNNPVAVLLGDPQAVCLYPADRWRQAEGSRHDRSH